MKTPEQLKKEHQLSNEEILEQANNLIENFIEPKIVALSKTTKTTRPSASLNKHSPAVSSLFRHISTINQRLSEIVSLRNVLAS